MANLIFESNDNFLLTNGSDYQNAGSITYWNHPSFENNYAANLITIEFNTDSTAYGNIKDFPDVIKTTMFIHEILHAELFRYILENLNELPPEINESVLLQLKKDENFNSIFNYFTIAANGNDFHHELIVNSYRITIYNALSEIYPNLTISELNALSWIGLEIQLNSKNKYSPIQFIIKIWELLGKI